jgi:hypothetical protein
MKKFVAATEEDICRARHDPAFRQQLLTTNLDQLLTLLQRLKQANEQHRTTRGTRQLREGAQLAARLADIIRELEERRRAQG